MKKCLFFLLCIILLTGLSVDTTAAKKCKLSKTKVTVNPNKQTTITVKNIPKKTKTVKWSVSKKGYVTIKKSGKKNKTLEIKAKKKTGKCVVTAKVGKKKLKCTVTIKKKSGQKPPTKPSQEKNTEETFNRAMIKTSVSLLKEADKESKENILISPDSVVSAMNMFMNGSKGDTRTEYEKAFGDFSVDSYNKNLQILHDKISKDKSITYQAANSLWYREKKANVKTSYKDVIKKYYDAEVFGKPFDPSTVSEINQWVSQKTDKKIDRIIDDISYDTNIIGINAVYFKGNWAEPYNGTTKKPFIKEDSTKKDVDMLEGTENYYFELNEGTGFMKPYMGGDTAFLAILPPKGMKVNDFVASIDPEEYQKAYKNIKSEYLVRTRMPKFSYEYQTSLSKPLNGMGIKKAFTNVADFGDMTDTPSHIDDVLHKTYINLDEEGTEAAAVTAVIAKANSAVVKREIKEVYLDCPFVYAIVERSTGIPLFFGVVKEVKN